MLGKLFAYEWKATWKVPVAICIYLGALTLLGCASFISPLWNTNSDFVGLLLGFSTMVYIISLIGACLATFIYFVVRFYKNMYTNEGYLMHALPVKSYQHIISKGLIFLIWTVLSGLMVFCSILMILCTALFTQVGEIGFAEFLGELGYGFRLFLQEFERVLTMPLPLVILIGIICILVACISQILQIYGAISIGQTFKKYKVMASLAAYIGLSLMLQFISSIIILPNMLRQIGLFTTSDMAYSTENSISQIFSSATYINLGISIACSIGFYLLTEHIMRKKLNLD